LASYKSTKEIARISLPKVAFGERRYTNNFRITCCVVR
jgi:hypothetical protein